MKQQDSRKRYLGFHRGMDNFMNMHPHLIAWYIMKGYLEPTVSDTDIDSIDLELTNTGDAWLHHGIPSAPDTAPTVNAAAGDTYTIRPATHGDGWDVVNEVEEQVYFRNLLIADAQMKISQMNRKPVPGEPDSAAGTDTWEQGIDMAGVAFVQRTNYMEHVAYSVPDLDEAIGLAETLQAYEDKLTSAQERIAALEAVASAAKSDMDAMASELTWSQDLITKLRAEEDSSDKLLIECERKLSALMQEKYALEDAVNRAYSKLKDYSGQEFNVQVVIAKETLEPYTTPENTEDTAA